MISKYEVKIIFRESSLFMYYSHQHPMIPEFYVYECPKILELILLNYYSQKLCQHACWLRPIVLCDWEHKTQAAKLFVQ